MIAPAAGLLPRLTAWDSALFTILNALHSPFWDTVMQQVSSPWVLVPVHLLLLAALFRRTDWRQRGGLLALLLFVILVDLVGAHAIKDTVQRVRPCHQDSLAATIHFVGGRSSGAYSFVSTHTAYAFALAAFAWFGLRRRRLALALCAWAAAVGYSRIYLGLHFPGDILGGALWGVMAAGAVTAAAALVRRFVQRQRSFAPAHAETVPTETAPTLTASAVSAQMPLHS